MDCYSSRCTEIADASQPTKRSSQFDPQRRTQEDATPDLVPKIIVETTADTTVDTTFHSSSNPNDIEMAPRQRKGRGRAKPMKMPTYGSKIPLVLDNGGNISQNIRWEIVVQLKENLPDACTAWGFVSQEHRDFYWN
ncbi:hypothetical protein SLA2020_051350 [Shorea laevis]